MTQADPRTPSPHRVAARVWKATTTVAALAALAIALTMLVPSLLGFERYVIEGGSMGGSLPRGSLAFDRTVPVAELRAGDVITYRPPANAGHTRLLTHRIVWTGRDRTGAPAFRTRGDANRATDPWRFTLSRPTQARVAFHVPYVGYALMALGDRRARVLLIGLPALLIALSLL